VEGVYIVIVVIYS